MLSLLYTLVKLAKSHYLLLSFVCILYIAFVCLFKLFVCIFNFLLPLVVNKDVHIPSSSNQSRATAASTANLALRSIAWCCHLSVYYESLWQLAVYPYCCIGNKRRIIATNKQMQSTQNNTGYWLDEINSGRGQRLGACAAPSPALEPRRGLNRADRRWRLSKCLKRYGLNWYYLTVFNGASNYRPSS